MDKKEKFKTFIFIFILCGIYVFIFSDTGILERRELNKKYNLLLKKIDYIKSSNSDLSKECENYRNGLYSSNDIIGSGFVYKTGNLLYIDEKEKEKIPKSGIIPDDFTISLEHLRIIWIVISTMFIFYYILKKNKSDEIIDGPDIN